MFRIWRIFPFFQFLDTGWVYNLLIVAWNINIYAISWPLWSYPLSRETLEKILKIIHWDLGWYQIAIFPVLAWKTIYLFDKLLQLYMINCSTPNPNSNKQLGVSIIIVKICLLSLLHPFGSYAESWQNMGVRQRHEFISWNLLYGK